MNYKKMAALSLVLGTLANGAQAATFSDTSISYRYGTKFAEPFNNQDVSKNIIALTHVSGYSFGTNFFNLDFLMSDKKDPGSLTQSSGAQEAYLVYRNTIDLGSLSGRDMKFGPFKALGLQLGFDVNTKNDVGYNSRKRMLVAGPMLSWDVPGRLNTGVLILQESNAPSGAFPPISGVKGRYTYKTHAAFSMDFGFPVASLPLSFEGYGLIIAPKGRDEVGADTATETHFDVSLMWDLGPSMGMAKNSFKAGLEYEYWKNKFGNKASIAGPGSFAKTPMVRVEYHF